MVKPGGGFRLALETLAGFVVTQQMRRKEFQRDGTVEFGVLGLVDHTHATLAEFLGDFVVRDSVADHYLGRVNSWGAEGVFVRL